jgi:tetratricopeptide (TPR) repeat protein
MNDAGDTEAAAIKKFDEAIAIEPDGRWVANAYFFKGQALSRLKRYAEACKAFEQALRINPEDRDAQRDLEYAQKRLN